MTSSSIYPNRQASKEGQDNLSLELDQLYQNTSHLRDPAAHKAEPFLVNTCPSLPSESRTALDNLINTSQPSRLSHPSHQISAITSQFSPLVTITSTITFFKEGSAPPPPPSSPSNIYNHMFSNAYMHVSQKPASLQFQATTKTRGTRRGSPSPVVKTVGYAQCGAGTDIKWEGKERVAEPSSSPQVSLPAIHSSIPVQYHEIDE